MPIFQKPTLKQGTNRKREMPEGLWQKCPECGEVVHNLELSQNLKVCPKCDYHFTFSARERISNLIDEGTFEEFDQNLLSVDVLKFTGVASYSERLQSYREKTGLADAVVTGFGRLGGHDIGLAVMDFNFLAATMGSAVGEKITRLVEKGTKAGRPIVVVTASGGARVYEGMLSLMQMAKISSALAQLDDARVPYISVLTDPTTGGVTASFAMLGDLNIAEPGALIGFAGPRVIEQTIRQKLPEGFQRSEFLLEKGFLDAVVHRRDMKSYLSRALDFLNAPALSA